MAVDFNSNFDETVPWTNDCAQFALATGVALTYTVPGSANTRYSMLLTYNETSNIFVGYNVTAVTPGAGTVTTTPNIEYRPGDDGTKRYVSAGDVISFITPDASAYVGLRLMRLPG